MLRWDVGLSLACACALLLGSAHAEEIDAGTEYQRNLHASGLIEPHASSFGANIDLYSGGLSFEHVDLRLTGTGPDIVIARRYSAGSQEVRNPWAGFVDWTLVIPQITTFTQVPSSGPYGGSEPALDVPGKWEVNTSDPAHRTARCTYFDKPVRNVTQTIVTNWWFGHQLVTYSGKEELLVREAGSWSPAAPIAGAAPYTGVTKSGWVTGCLPATSNDVPGEGFLGISPSGERYSFTHLVFNRDETVRQPDVFDSRMWRLYRSRAHMLVSRVSDRFGNTVDYQYSGPRLIRIVASDGREVSLQWSSDGSRIESITSQPGTSVSRTWTYSYNASGLALVELPDSSSWQINLPFDTYQPLEPYTSNCVVNESIGGAGNQLTGSITSPSGATGAFVLTAKRHGRSAVFNAECIVDPTGPERVRVPPFFDSLTLVERSISGPGLDPLVWTYSYSSPVYSSQAECETAGCVDSSWVAVKQPDGSTISYTHSTRDGATEGQLRKKEVLTSTGAVLDRTSYSYADASHGPWPEFVGKAFNHGYSSERKLTAITPVSSVAITRDGEIFQVATTAYDKYARPLSVSRSSSLGYSKTEVTSYHNDLDDWVLGQVRAVTVDGVQVSRTDYNANALPYRTYAFGKVQQNLTYHAEGNLRTHADGNSNTTRFDYWKRGIPGRITYQDGATTSAAIKDDGTIASVTDENGYKTSYSYDAMGRLARTEYPAGDSVAWLPRVQSFGQIGTPEHGIPAGHWRQSVSQGNYRKYTYFDALWRPILVHEYDAANVSATLRSAAFRYDHEGRTTFESYAGSGTAAPSTGRHFTYDALGRLRTIQQDSELGLLTTTRDYLPGSSGSYLLVTDPRQKQTRTWFQAFDTPSEAAPVRIEHPEGAVTDIARDVFGAPQSLTRSNAGGSLSVSRYFVYDDHHRLCKRLEPETRASVFAYDNAGNVAWSASGLDLPSTTDCNTADVPLAAKVIRSYDGRNRLETLDFSDGNGSQLWQYTPDGMPSRITTFNSGGATSIVNTYTYNKRRLLTAETSSQPGLYSWTMDYGYDGYGHLSRHSYPGNLIVDYAPNALGQPTRVGSYATGVSYYPNGAIKRFTYGNGIIHTLQQNARRLPERSRDALGSTAVHDDSYDYDANGNVIAISDALPTARGHRDMTYDGLNRLKTAVSPMFGSASYTYDVLDNLKTTKVDGRNHTYHYDPSRQQLINVKDTITGATVIGLAYDAQGNLSNRNGVLYHFDIGNRLREVEGKESYRYDAHGRRIQATHPVLGSIYSMYGQDGVLRYQEDYREAEASRYIYLSGSLLAKVSEQTVTMSVPSLAAPANDYDGAYHVSWTAVAGAAEYRLEESINGGAWLHVTESATLGWDTSAKGNGSYRYRVRACAMDCSDYSAIATVVVERVPYAAPSITAPDYVTDGSYTVQWTTVTYATDYELRERPSGGAWDAIHYDAAISKAISGKASGAYEYQVRGCNIHDCGPWSGVETVSVELPPANPPDLNVPSHGPNGDYVVSWTSVAGATYYALDESVNGGIWGEAYRGGALNLTYSDRASGNYAYRVRACNPADCSSVSPSKSVQVVYPPTEPPTISAPATNTDGGYTVEWSAIASATYYKLEESAHGAAWKLIYDGGGRSKAVSSKTHGPYDYRVRACNIAGCGPWSAIHTVQEIDPPGSASTPTAPELSANGSYSVSWAAVSRATKYLLEEQVSGGSWEPAYEGSARSKGFSGKAAASYGYRVRGCNGAGCGGVSPVRTVRVVYKPASPPSLSAPAVSYSGSYTVSWGGVATSTRYVLQMSRNGAAWSTIVNGTARSYAAQAQANGSYGYRVQACNDGGCSSWSAIRTTTVKPPAAPAWLTVDMEYQPGPMRPPVKVWNLDWPASTGANRYQVQQQIYDGTPAIIYDGSGTSASEAGTGNRTFWVRACNGSRCSGWREGAAP